MTDLPLRMALSPLQEDEVDGDDRDDRDGHRPDHRPWRPAGSCDAHIQTPIRPGLSPELLLEGPWLTATDGPGAGTWMTIVVGAPPPRDASCHQPYRSGLASALADVPCHPCGASDQTPRRPRPK